MSEDLTDYLLELGIRVRYLHSEIDTLERIEILRSLRLGEFDVLVGINLLREGLDLPEVSLVAILDADKEGFLRSATSLIQTIGRAARNVDGQVIMYADRMTDSMQLRDLGDDASPAEADRIQHRARHRSADRAQEGHRHPRDDPGARPATRIPTTAVRGRGRGRSRPSARAHRPARSPRDELGRLIQSLTDEMHDAARDLRFEEAARSRDEIHEMKRELREVSCSPASFVSRGRVARHKPATAAATSSAWIAQPQPPAAIVQTVGVSLPCSSWSLHHVKSDRWMFTTALVVITAHAMQERAPRAGHDGQPPDAGPGHRERSREERQRGDQVARARRFAAPRVRPRRLQREQAWRNRGGRPPRRLGRGRAFSRRSPRPRGRPARGASRGATRARRTRSAP